MENNEQISIKHIEDFCKPTFIKISSDKREKILNGAEKEFAIYGYNGANINNIAKNVGISIGSMYSYFESKEHLFLAVLQRGVNLVEQAVESINVDEYEFYQFLKNFLIISREYAIEYPYINQIYIDLASFATEKFSAKLSRSIESITNNLYKEVIKKGKTDGLIKDNIKDELLCYYIDNIIMTYQFSFASSYWKNRMELILDGKYTDFDDIENELVNIIKYGLKP